MDQNDIVSCPYNPQHRMRAPRLIFHLARQCKDCQKLKHLYAHCRYNYLHVFKKEEIQNHENNCLDKIEIENFQFEERQQQCEAQQPDIQDQWGKIEQREDDICEEKIEQKQQVEEMDQMANQLENLKIERQNDIWDDIWDDQIGFNDNYFL